MFRCTKCRLATYSTAQVTPYASSQHLQGTVPGFSASNEPQGDVDIYFIVSHPLIIDINTQIAYSGGEGNFLRVFLNRQGITNYRIFTLTRCIPYRTAYPEQISPVPLPPPIQTVREPQTDEIKCCQQYLLKDIVMHHPKVLVPMGTTALRWLMGDNSLHIKDCRGKVFYRKILDTEYMVIPTHDAEFMVSNGHNMDLAEKFDNDLEKAKHLADGTWSDVTRVNELTYATDYQTFKNYYLTVLKDCDEIAYDIETNAALVFDRRFDIIGFSLAKKRKGIYVSLRALDKKMSPQEIVQCKTLLKAILRNTRKIYVHNCLYERPATLYNIGYDFPFDQIEDTLVMAKLMLGGKIGAGLKPNAQRIGYPDWETDLLQYLSYLNQVSGGKKGFHALVKYHSFYDAMREHITLQDFSDGLRSSYYSLLETFPEAVQYIPFARIPDRDSVEYPYLKNLFPVIDSIIPDKLPPKESKDPKDIRAYQDILQKLPDNVRNLFTGNPSSEQKAEAQAYLKNNPLAKILIDLSKKMSTLVSTTTQVTEMLNVADGMRELIRKYYDDPKEVDDLLHKISDIMIEYLDHGIIGDVPPYDWIPWRIITKYGATDALATIDLRDYYLDRFKKESTKEVDLFKGYKYALMEHYVGHCLMMAGIKWDDASATRDRNKYISILGKTIGFLFTSPKVIHYIAREKWETYCPSVIYEYYNDYMWQTYHQKVGIASSKDGVDIYKTIYIDPKSGKEKMKHIRHIFTDLNGNEIKLNDDIAQDIVDKCCEQIRKEIADIPGEDYERLKSEYFNPMAMDESLPVLVNDILVMEAVHVGRFIHECEKIYSSEDFKLQSKTSIRGYSTLYNEYMKNLFDRDFPNAGSNIMERAEKFKEFVTLHKKVQESEYSQQYFLDNFVKDTVFWKTFDTFESSKDLDVKRDAYKKITEFYREAVNLSLNGLEDFVKKQEDLKKKESELEKKGFRKKTAPRDVSFLTYFVSDELRNALLDAYLFHISGLTDDDQIDIYNALILDPDMDPDKESTWSYEMRWLFNFRCFRKAYKMVGTYIDGSSGRENVYIVDKKKLSDGLDVVPRLEPYTDYISSGPMTEDIAELKKNNEVDYLEQVVFGVGTAETGRWRSGIHTLPAASTLKKLYSSRFRGGTILMPDFSANEMRCVASYAQEDAMLKAFADGLDIHKANAASVFNVPYEQVTKAQRKFSKAVSFGILYGSSARSLAESYFNGNLARAQSLLDNFYATFPKLKSWIDGKHKEAMETHKVSVLTNRFLTIDFDPGDRKSLGRAMRQSQNWPIQSAASSVAAIVFCDIILFMRRNNMKSKPICFIHDSLESDVYPYEFFKLIEHQQYELANSALKMFNLALKADVAMGINMGSECEMNNLDIMNEEKTEGKITLEGYKTDIMDLVENWKTAYNLVEVVEEEWEEEVGQMELLFMKKKSFDPSIHAHRLKGTATIHIRYYNDKGEVDPMNTGEPNLYDIWEDFPLYDYMGVKEENKGE